MVPAHGPFCCRIAIDLQKFSSSPTLISWDRIVDIGSTNWDGLYFSVFAYLMFVIKEGMMNTSCPYSVCPRVRSFQPLNPLGLNLEVWFLWMQEPRSFNFPPSSRAYKYHWLTAFGSWFRFFSSHYLLVVQCASYRWKYGFCYYRQHYRSIILRFFCTTLTDYRSKIFFRTCLHICVYADKSSSVCLSTCWFS